MGGTAPFKKLIAEMCSTGRYTPAHVILGSMRLPAVTTNYDHLYEMAVASSQSETGEAMEVLVLSPPRLRCLTHV